jgi:peptidoglycan/LPS O-acetylase OafA/YrhL
MSNLPPQLHPKYRADIDGLRAIAVISVIAFHAFPEWISGGFIGVDIFFVISGYLISTIIFENLNKGNFSFTEFFARRVLRIFPALILVLMFCFSFGYTTLLADEFMQLGKHIAAGAGFISNIVFWNEAGYFDNSADTKPLLHLWSLGIEEQFYLVWPAFLWFAWKLRVSLIILTICLAIASFTINIATVYEHPVAAFYSPLSRFWELLIGAALAYVILYRQALVARWSRYGELISGIALCSFILGVVLLAKTSVFPGWWALLPTFAGAAMIFSGPHVWVNRIILSNKAFVWLGLISYPLYLWHWPLLSFARIVEGEVPSLGIRIALVALSLVLAWLTYRFIERPIRFGRHPKIAVSVLALLMVIVGFIGFNTYGRDGLEFRQAHKIGIIENANRLAWYEGKEDWLFLGSAYDKSVAKLTLSITPPEKKVQETKELFSKIAKTAAEYNIKVVLIMGPDKSSIYPEYLPDDIRPSPKKYSSYFLEALGDIPNLIIYNPTNDLLRLKKNEGLLYWKTDSHWNNKGAFLAYSGFSDLLDLPAPAVNFKNGGPHSGDLINISRLKNFPLHGDDNWDVIWKVKSDWTEKEIPNEKKDTPFGSATITDNRNPLSSKSIWVVGDSFTSALRQYFNSTFKEVRYFGQWSEKLNNLPADLVKAEKKPDMIVIVRVERSF